MILQDNDIAENYVYSQQDRITVVKVEKCTDLAAELADFIINSSWDEAKEHISELVRNWDFADNEAVFAAIADGKIIGMSTLMNTDYYPLPDIFPWVSCIFVSEEYRGRRICGKLIDAANAYARSLGHVKTYIPSPFSGLYERYGYRYIKDIVNYGGDTDHLFVKEI